jgi:predicted RNA-binding Zn-ribbon protein involved in translation (DUF1610 family)
MLGTSPAGDVRVYCNECGESALIPEAALDELCRPYECSECQDPDVEYGLGQR